MSYYEKKIADVNSDSGIEAEIWIRNIKFGLVDIWFKVKDISRNKFYKEFREKLKEEHYLYLQNNLNSYVDKECIVTNFDNELEIFFVIKKQDLETWLRKIKKGITE